MHHVILCGIVIDELLLLFLLLVDGFLRGSLLVFLLLGDFLRLLLVCLLVQGGQSGLLTLQLGVDGLQLLREFGVDG